MESMFSSNRPGWAALLDEKVTAYLPDLKYIHDEPLARHTSFRIGGPATRMAFPTSGDQIVLLTGFAQECGVTPFLLGNGTNLLVADEGLDTLVIQTGEGLTRAYRSRGWAFLPGSTASRDWSSRTAFPAVSAAAW